MSQTQHSPSLISVALGWAGSYEARAEHRRAERFYRAACLACRQESTRSEGCDAGQRAECVNHLARCFRLQGRYRPAEALHRAALALAEHVTEIDEALVAVILNDIGILYKNMARFDEAEEPCVDHL